MGMGLNKQLACRQQGWCVFQLLLLKIFMSRPPEVRVINRVDFSIFETIKTERREFVFKST